MLTQEQINNLKNGDPIVVKGIFSEVYADGNIVMQIVQKHKDKIEHDFRFFDPYSVSLPLEHGTSLSRRSSVGAETEVPTPKYGPTRLFKKGDKVRVVEWNGRHFHDRDHGTELTTGCICEVDDDEEATSEHGVLVVYEEQVRFIAPCYLELVTPAEELEPYYIEEETFDYEIRNANDDPDIGTSLAFHVMFQDPDEGQILRVKSYYESYVYSREHAKAAAEAERDRLNAEWRKEHANE